MARNSCVESLEAKFCVRTGTGPEFPGVGRVQTCGGAVECRGGEEGKVGHEILPRLIPTPLHPASGARPDFGRGEKLPQLPLMMDEST